MRSQAHQLHGHWDVMVRVARGVLGSRDEAEECASHALAQVCEQRPSDVLNMEAYLVTVAKCRALDRLRQLDRARRRDARILEQATLHVADIAEDVTRQAEARWMSERARQLLEPRVFTLLTRVGDGEDVASIAADLQMTTGAAHSQLHRARKLLREIYARALAVLGLGWLGAKRLAPATAPVVVMVALVLTPLFGVAGHPSQPSQPTLPPTVNVTDADNLTAYPRQITTGVAAVPRPGSGPSAAAPVRKRSVPVPQSTTVAEVRGPLEVGARVEGRKGSGQPEDGDLVADLWHCAQTIEVQPNHIGC